MTHYAKILYLQAAIPTLLGTTTFPISCSKRLDHSVYCGLPTTKENFKSDCENEIENKYDFSNLVCMHITPILYLESPCVLNSIRKDRQLLKCDWFEIRMLYWYSNLTLVSNIGSALIT